MTATLADIRKAAEGNMWVGTDDTTPLGYFVAVAKILGLTTTFLLAGDEPSEDAPVIGRIELYDVDRAPGVYVGGGLKGGTYRRADDETAAFLLMVEHAR